MSLSPLTSSPSSKSPTPSERLVYHLYRVFEFVLKLAPIKLLSSLGAGIGLLLFHFLKERRQVVTRNLRIAFGEEMSQEEIHALTKKTFLHSGANLIASLRTSSFTEQQIRDHIEFVGVENLDTAREQGTGLIGLLSHMGNWELIAQIHLALPALCPPGALYRPIDNPLIDNLIKRRRSNEGTRLFSRRDGFFKPIAHLKSGGCLGVLADQHAGAHGLAVPFFGKLTSMTNLPAIMHRRTGAAIVPLSMESTTRGKWRVTIHPPIDIPADKKSDTLYITMLCAKAYETIMRTSPADVFWMHGYWKTGRKGPLKIDGLQKKRAPGTQRALATKPFRVMVYTGNAPENQQEIAEALHRLKGYRPDIHLTVVGETSFSPEADHAIPMADSSELTQTIKEYNAAAPQPLDCALDFTPGGAGGDIFEQAELTHIFTLYGKHQGRRTSSLFSRTDHPNLDDFLNSLGIQD